MTSKKGFNKTANKSCHNRKDNKYKDEDKYNWPNFISVRLEIFDYLNQENSSNNTQPYNDEKNDDKSAFVLLDVFKYIRTV